MKEAIELIESALKEAEDHPMFLGHKSSGTTESDVEHEGGDAATFTVIAWNLKEALEILRR